MSNSFHYMSMAIHSMIHKKIFTNLKEEGLTIGQPKVLDYLRENEDASNKDIAGACYIEPATLTSVLGRMEKQGLAERITPDENRRILKINLTPEGKQKADQVNAEFMQIEDAAFQGISKEEREQFQGTYEKIYQNLKDYVKEGEKWRN